MDGRLNLLTKPHSINLLTKVQLQTLHNVCKVIDAQFWLLMRRHFWYENWPWALTPSHVRLSQIGSVGSVPGRPLICASCGPMAQKVDTVVKVMRCLLASSMPRLDPYTAPLPFREELFSTDQKLTIGYFDFDGWFQPVPACVRAVHQAKDALESSGHKLVPWEPPNVPKAVTLFMSAAVVDGGRYLLNMLRNDIPEPLNAQTVHLFRLPPFLRRFLGRILSLTYSSQIGRVLMAMPQNTSELRAIYEQISVYRKEFVKKWKEAELDCLLCPALATPALPHDYPMKVGNVISWTAVYNLLDFCAGVVPCTKVTKKDEKDTKEKYKVNDYMFSLIRKANISGSVGLPVGVQCVALPFQEEICLRLMKEVESAVGKM